MSARLELGQIERVKMPASRSGRRVGDRYACGLGHWHPSYRHALKCRERARRAALEASRKNLA